MRLLSLAALALASLLSLTVLAEPKVLEWDDLIPPGIPYSEIIGEGEVDEANDRWKPEYDPNGYLLNQDLNGQQVKVPGFVVPLEVDSNGIHSFLLVPYAGACIHTPPPPPNQLILVHTPAPWADHEWWEPVWITGELRTQVQDTDIAESGYVMGADAIEVYEWQ